LRELQGVAAGAAISEAVATLCVAGKGWTTRLCEAFLCVPPANLRASEAAVAQMMAALLQAQRGGLVQQAVAARVTQRLTTCLLLLLQVLQCVAVCCSVL